MSFAFSSAQPPLELEVSQSFWLQFPQKAACKLLTKTQFSFTVFKHYIISFLVTNAVMLSSSLIAFLLYGFILQSVTEGNSKCSFFI